MVFFVWSELRALEEGFPHGYSSKRKRTKLVAIILYTSNQHKDPMHNNIIEPDHRSSLNPPVAVLPLRILALRVLCRLGAGSQLRISSDRRLKDVVLRLICRPMSRTGDPTTGTYQFAILSNVGFASFLEDVPYGEPRFGSDPK
ncbi:hypothetical protein RND71_012764 [Anisodus tanguticus]|uniref:Uncharacterized protein n=1 Tax=Anisodus tanguticus TaxID=243964 RepID=A0AAE1SGC9_9SOLA|nr:hypothetical protein RND71_012764 [Anisodus tanguticus]